jgi:hypothetical protein
VGFFGTLIRSYSDATGALAEIGKTFEDFLVRLGDRSGNSRLGFRLALRQMY